MVRAGLTGARWIDPENYHMTLRFLGDVDGTTARDFAHSLGDIAASPFELRLDALGSFGGRKPRAIFAAVAPSNALELLQRAHERAARAAGLLLEPRNYTPHVTVARLRGTSSYSSPPISSARVDFQPALRGVALRAVLFARLGRRRATWWKQPTVED